MNITTSVVVLMVSSSLSQFHSHSITAQVVTTKNLFAHPQGLPGIFADILDFIPKYCSLLMELTSRGGLSEGEEHAHILKGFDFLVNAVWPDVVTLIEQKASLIFAPGDPNAFHKVSLVYLVASNLRVSCVGLGGYVYAPLLPTRDLSSV